MSAPASSYAVGYGRPPSHSQFKTGQSGNPRGRPPGSKNLQTILREELDQKVQVNDSGRSKLMTKRRIAVRQQVDKAVKGDAKAFSVLVKLDIDPGGSTIGPHSPDAGLPSEIPPAAYDDVVSSFLEQFQDRAGGSDDGFASSD